MSNERMERPTARQMAHIKEAVDALVDGGRGFLWGPCHPEGGFASHEEVAAEYAEIVQMTAEANPERSRELWGVFVNRGDESLFVCHTGNGPKSEAHARFIAAAPWAIHALLAEVGATEVKLAEAVSLASKHETALAHAQVIVADAETRRSAAETARISAESDRDALEARVEKLERDREDWRGSAGIWKNDHDVQKARADGLADKLRSLVDAIDARNATREAFDDFKFQWASSSTGPTSEDEWARKWARNDELVKAHRAADADYEAALEAARGEP